MNTNAGSPPPQPTVHAPHGVLADDDDRDAGARDVRSTFGDTAEDHGPAERQRGRYRHGNRAPCECGGQHAAACFRRGVVPPA